MRVLNNFNSSIVAVIEFQQRLRHRVMLLTFSLALSYTTRATAALTRLSTQTLSTRESVSKSFSADTC